MPGQGDVRRRRRPDRGSVRTIDLRSKLQKTVNGRPRVTVDGARGRPWTGQLDAPGSPDMRRPPPGDAHQGHDEEEGAHPEQLPITLRGDVYDSPR
jgi:hypothetical protein